MFIGLVLNVEIKEHFDLPFSFICVLCNRRSSKLKMDKLVKTNVNSSIIQNYYYDSVGTAKVKQVKCLSTNEWKAKRDLSIHWNIIQPEKEVKFDHYHMDDP